MNEPESGIKPDDYRARTLELIAALMLGLATIASSWCAYQSSLWSGTQAVRFNRAAGLRVEANRVETKAGQQNITDIGLFIQWLNASANKDEVRANFYRQHFRPEFAPLFEKWLALRPLVNKDVSRTPFEMPGYRLATTAKADMLKSQADMTFAEGEKANSNSDIFTRNGVLLTTSLFFAGIVPQFRQSRIRIVLLSIAGMLLTWGITVALTAPRL
jgi:hypothetical protein